MAHILKNETTTTGRPFKSKKPFLFYLPRLPQISLIHSVQWFNFFRPAVKALSKTAIFLEKNVFPSAAVDADADVDVADIHIQIVAQFYISIFVSLSAYYGLYG